MTHKYIRPTKENEQPKTRNLDQSAILRDQTAYKTSQDPVTPPSNSHLVPPLTQHHFTYSDHDRESLNEVSGGVVQLLFGVERGSWGDGSDGSGLLRGSEGNPGICRSVRRESLDS